MIQQLQIGAQATTASLSSTTTPNLRGGNMGDLIISQLQPRYYESVYRGAMFSAANTAAVATTAIAATTYTGLSVSNPIGSGRNIVLCKAAWAASAAISAADVLALQTGYNSSTNVTHTTPVTVASNLIGTGASGLALADSAATLPTAPASRFILTSGGTLATTGYSIGATGVIDLEGSIILPPGAYASFATSSANTAAWWFSLSWIEVPV